MLFPNLSLAVSVDLILRWNEINDRGNISMALKPKNSINSVIDNKCDQCALRWNTTIKQQHVYMTQAVLKSITKKKVSNFIQ